VSFAIANALGGVESMLVMPLVLALTAVAWHGARRERRRHAHGGALAAVGRHPATGRRHDGFVGLFAVSAIVIGLRPCVLPPGHVRDRGLRGPHQRAGSHWCRWSSDLLGRILATCLMFARTVMPLGYLVPDPRDHV
jgi:hypothetical protein